MVSIQILNSIEMLSRFVLVIDVLQVIDLQNEVRNNKRNDVISWWYDGMVL